MSKRTISRRSFLKVCATGGISALLAACGKLSGSKDIQPLVPTDQSQSNLHVETTSTPVVSGLPRGTPPANTKLPPNWTRGKVARERTLIYNGAGTDYPNCNPLAWNGQLLEGGAYYSVTADKTILWMLESYQYLADGTEIIIKFRAGIEWSDGKPYTAHDAQFGFETALRLGWPEITGVEVIDELTLKVKLTKRDWRFFFRNLVYSYWNGNPSLIIPEHIFRNFTDQQLKAMSVYGQDPTSSYGMEQAFSFFDPEKNYPVVTGPYMMVKTDPDILKEFGYVDVNVYDLRPDWWAVKAGLVSEMPVVERLITVALEDTPEMQTRQFTDNLVDYCDNSLVDPEAIRSILLKARQVSTWTGDQPPFGHVFPDVGGLGFNCQQAPFNDARIRWAIANVIDSRNLLESVYGQDVEVAKSPFPAFPAYNKMMDSLGDLKNEYDFLRFDPSKSVQLMQEAGFTKRSDGIWVDKNGTPIAMTLFADGKNSWFSTESYAELAGAIAEQLRQAGFDCQVKLFEEDPQTVAENGVTELTNTWSTAAKGLAPLFIINHLGTGTSDPVDLFSYYREYPATQEYWFNITRWVDADFTRSVEELIGLHQDDPRYIDTFRKCMEIWYRNLPFIPLFQTYNRVPYNTRYWQNWPSADNPYIPIGFGSRDALMLVINLKAQI